MPARESAGVRLAWYAAVVLFTLAYLTHNFRLHRADLSAPLGRPAGDAVALLALVTAVDEGGWPWVVARAGAPGEAERLDYPVPEHAQTLLLRFLLLFTDNPFLAFNLWAILSYPLTAAITFGVFRAIGISRPVGFAVAILFTFLPFHGARVFTQTFLAHYYTVPLIAVPAVWITQGRLPFFGTADEAGRRRLSVWNLTTGSAVLIAGFVAVTTAYFAFFGCVFLAVAGVYRGFAERSWRPMVSGLSVAGIVTTIGFVSTLPTVLYQREHGVNPAVAQRNANEAEVYCLKVTQLVLPFDGHRVNALGHMTRLYNADAALTNENRDSSLGIVGAIGFVLLLVRLLVPAGPTLLGGLSVLTLVAVLLGTSAGLGALFNFAVFPQIRCYNRVCVFVAFFALLAVAVLVDRWAGPGRRSWFAAVALLAVGLLDMTSLAQAPKHAELQQQHAEWRGFVGRMEAAVPPGGMVFQLPAATYPEAGPIHRMPDYAHFACYAYSQTLRWSYGTNRNRRWAEWQTYVAKLPPAEMVRALATAGFAGIYIDRRGYSDPEPVAAEFRALLGPAVATSDSGEQLLFSLAQAPADHDRERLLNRPCVLLQKGFVPWAKDNPRRAMHEAEMRLVNPGPEVRRVSLTMDWRRLSPAELSVHVTGLGVDATLVPPTDRGPVALDLDVPPGEHVLRFNASHQPFGPARFYAAWDATNVRLIDRDGGRP